MTPVGQLLASGLGLGGLVLNPGRPNYLAKSTSRHASNGDRLPQDAPPAQPVSDRLTPFVGYRVNRSVITEAAPAGFSSGIPAFRSGVTRSGLRLDAGKGRVVSDCDRAERRDSSHVRPSQLSSAAGGDARAT